MADSRIKEIPFHQLVDAFLLAAIEDLCGLTSDYRKGLSVERVIDCGLPPRVIHGRAVRANAGSVAHELYNRSRVIHGISISDHVRMSLEASKVKLATRQTRAEIQSQIDAQHAVLFAWNRGDKGVSASDVAPAIKVLEKLAEQLKACN